ncbi:MAG TPA: cytochrome c3 family protein, partial [Nitrospira sp.]
MPLAVSTAWADNVETALMPGQVIEGHAKWEEDCTKCHKRFDKAAQTQLCQDCHKDVRTDITQKRGFHGRLKEQRECKECHTEHKGRTEHTAPINEQTFDHSQTDFA